MCQWVFSEGLVIDMEMNAFKSIAYFHNASPLGDLILYLPVQISIPCQRLYFHPVRGALLVAKKSTCTLVSKSPRKGVFLVKKNWIH